LMTLPGPNPVCPQRGPYEASEGIYPVMGKRKLGEGKLLHFSSFKLQVHPFFCEFKLEKCTATASKICTGFKDKTSSLG